MRTKKPKQQSEVRQLTKVAGKLVNLVLATTKGARKAAGISIDPTGGHAENMGELQAAMAEIASDFKQVWAKVNIHRRMNASGKLVETKARAEVSNLLGQAYTQADVLLNIASKVHSTCGKAYSNSNAHHANNWLELNADMGNNDQLILTSLRHLQGCMRKYGDKFEVNHIGADPHSGEPGKLVLKLHIPPFIAHDKAHHVRLAYPDCYITVDPAKPPCSAPWGILGVFPALKDQARPHPHIYQNDSAYTCFGDYQHFVSQAFQECRWLDVMELMEMLATDPKHASSIHHFQQWPQCEVECSGCKAWIPFKKAKYSKGEQIYNIKKWYCASCCTTCPVTGHMIEKATWVEIDGKHYHDSACWDIAGTKRLKTECLPDATGQYYFHPETADVCCVTGMMDLAQAMGTSSALSNYNSPLTLFKLPNGKCVIAACLDMIDEEGNLTQGDDNGKDEEAARRPWWQGKAGMAWAGLAHANPAAPRTKWAERLYARFDAGAKPAEPKPAGPKYKYATDTTASTADAPDW